MWHLHILLITFYVTFIFIVFLIFVFSLVALCHIIPSYIAINFYVTPQKSVILISMIWCISIQVHTTMTQTPASQPLIDDLVKGSHLVWLQQA